MRGSIQRRGRASWRIKYDLPGTTKRETRYTTVRGKRADAERELAKIISAAHGGTLVEPAKLLALMARRRARPRGQDAGALPAARRVANHPTPRRHAATAATARPHCGRAPKTS